MKNLITVLIFLGSPSVFAAELTDGHYRTASFYCGEDLVNDRATGNLVLVAHSNGCGDNGSLATFVRVSDWEFWTAISTTSVTDATVKKCTPRRGHALPCESWMYDENKNFVGQAGDQIKTGQTIKVMNPYAFTLSWNSALWRNGSVVTHVTSLYPAIFTTPAPKDCALHGLEARSASGEHGY